MKRLTFASLLLSAATTFAVGPSVDLAQPVGAFRKGLHGSNSTMWLYPVRTDKETADRALLKSMKFAELRTDDWANADYGQSIVDVYNVFPLLHLDASDPANYIFEQTDDLFAIDRSSVVGSPTICYRLGASDDKTHGHFNSAMPTNFAQYAEACAGIVRHYKDGWADGPLDAVARWEIWDSPDDANAGWYAGELSEAERRDRFAEFFATVLKRLREEFDDRIEIGGPGLTSYREDWFEAILDACEQKGVKPDYLSFRGFGTDAEAIAAQAETARAFLDSRDAVDVGLALSAWHYQNPGTSYHGDASALFTAKMLAKLPYTPFGRAYFYGTGASGNWSLFTTTERNVPVLQLYGKLAAQADTMLAAESTDATSVLGTLSADGLMAQLFVVDEAEGTASVTVNIAGAERVKAVSAELADSANDGASVTATCKDGVLTLPKKAGGATAWRVTVTLPPPAPTVTVGEPQDGRITLTFGNVVTDLALAMVYGRDAAGDAPADWQRFAAVGVLSNGTTTYTCELPESWSDQVGAVRFLVTELGDLPVAFLDGATMDRSGSGASKPQWFDADFKATSTTKVSVDWTPSQMTEASEWLFSSASTPAFEMYKNKEFHPGYAYGASGYKTQTSWSAADGTRTTWTLDGSGKKVSCDEKSATFSASWSGTGGGLVIGRGISGAGVCGTIHGVKVWSGSGATLRRDFVPAQTMTADGTRVTGFYDKVGGVFRASAGSAAFVAGATIDAAASELGNLIVLAASETVTTSVKPLHEHAWSEWIVDVEPQPGVPGHQYRDCPGCGAHQEQAIDPLPPLPPTGITTNAMATASWGYEIHGLGVAADEVALVFTNTAATMSLTLPENVAAISYLVIGGGGGGGGYMGGGGGAGRMIEGTSVACSAGAELTVTVGKGGTGSSGQTFSANPSGSNSTLAFDAVRVTAVGGGRGGYGSSTKNNGKAGSAGGDGGSGGGAGGCGTSTYSDPSVALAGGAPVGTDGFGHAGGAIPADKTAQCGAGGGGAGTPGCDTTVTTVHGGIGGEGRVSVITGDALYYAAGGSGGSGTNYQVPGQPLGGGGAGGHGAKSAGTYRGEDGKARRGSGGGGGGSGVNDTSMRGGNGGSGIVVVRYSESGTPSGKWSEVESSQVDGVTDANKAAVETTLDAIQTALPAGATTAEAGAWLAKVYGNQKVAAATLASAKQVGLSVKYDLPLLVSDNPTVTVEPSTKPVSEAGVAAFVFTIMDGENAVPIAQAKVREMVRYAATLTGGFEPSTAAEVAITPGGTSFTAELKRIDGRDSGFMKVELK